VIRRYGNRLDPGGEAHRPVCLPPMRRGICVCGYSRVSYKEFADRSVISAKTGF